MPWKESTNAHKRTNTIEGRIAKNPNVVKDWQAFNQSEINKTRSCNDLRKPTDWPEGFWSQKICVCKRHGNYQQYKYNW